MDIFDEDEFGVEIIVDTVVIWGKDIWKLEVIISDDDFLGKGYHAAIQVFQFQLNDIGACF